MELSIMGLNFVYALLGAAFTLAFSWPLATCCSTGLTPFDTGAELHNGNVAVGLVVGAIFVAVGIAIGLVIGMGLN